MPAAIVDCKLFSRAPGPAPYLRIGIAIFTLTCAFACSPLAADQKDGAAARSAPPKPNPRFTELFNAVDIETNLGERQEEKHWTNLAALPEEARVAIISFGVKQEPEKTAARAKWIVHAVAGLDPGGRLRRLMAEEVKRLQAAGANQEQELALLMLRRALRVEPVGEIAAALSRRIAIEDDVDVITELGEQLAELRGELTGEAVRPAALALLKHIQAEDDPVSIGGLAKVLSNLDADLRAEEAQRFGAAFVKRIPSETDNITAGQLAAVLVLTRRNLTADDLRLAADAVVQRMLHVKPSEKRFYALYDPFPLLVESLKASDARPLAQAIRKHLESDKEGFRLGEFSMMLLDLTARLPTNERREAEGYILKRLDSLFDPPTSSVSAEVYTLVERLGPDLFGYLAKKSIRQIESEPDPWKLAVLAEVLSRSKAIVKLPRNDVKRCAAKIVARIKEADPKDDLGEFTYVLGKLSPRLDPEDLHPAAVLLTERLMSQSLPAKRRSLADSFGQIAPRLAADDVRPVFTFVVDSLRKVAKDRFEFVPLAARLRALRAPLDAAAFRPAIALLIDRLQAEEDAFAAGMLAGLLLQMDDRIDADNSKRAEAVLYKRIGESGSADTQLCDAWLSILNRVRPALADQLPEIIEILQLPTSVSNHEAILDHVEELAGVAPAKFHGQVSKFVEWLETSEKVKPLNLRLDFRPH